MFPCSVPTSWELEKGASCRGVWRTLCSYLKFKYPGEHPRPEESIPDPRKASQTSSWPSQEKGAGRQMIDQHHGTPAPSSHLLLTRIFTWGITEFIFWVLLWPYKTTVDGETRGQDQRMLRWGECTFFCSFLLWQCHWSQATCYQKKKKFFEKKKKKNGHQKCLLSVAGFVSENEQTGSDWQMFPVNPESLRYCREWVCC